MNCQSVQNRILALPDPRHVPAALREHVVGCAGCRAWARQAARLESLLAQLPVPTAPADKKAELIDDLNRNAPLAVPAAAATESPDFLRRNALAIGSLAAAIMVALGAWWIFGGKNGPTPEMAAATPANPFLDKMVKRDIEMARADTAAKRLQVLGSLAGDLSTEAGSLARVASADDLRVIARWFDKVKDGMVKQADKLPPNALTPDERRKLLGDLAQKLEQTSAEAGRVAAEAPQESQAALRQIADAARDGERLLKAKAAQ